MPIWSLWVLKTIVLMVVGGALFASGLLLVSLPPDPLKNKRWPFLISLLRSWPTRFGLVLVQLVVAALMVTSFDHYVVKPSETHQVKLVQTQLRHNQQQVTQHLKVINDPDVSMKAQGQNIKAIQKLNAQAQKLQQNGNRVLLDYHWIYILPPTKGWF